MDAPETIQPAESTQPAIIDPQMDTNKVYEQEHERQHGISDDQPIQLAQNNVPTIPTADTHHIVQAPDGAKVAFPKGTPPDTMHAEMSKWWGPHLQKGAQAWNAVRNAASNAAEAVGLPGSMPELNAHVDEFMRNPLSKTADVVGAVVGGLAHGFNSSIPSTPENNALVERAQHEYEQGNTIAAATTLVPLIGDNLAKAVKQAQARDFSGSAGTAIGTVLPFLTDTLKAKGELPITQEKVVPPTTTSYEHTPAQNGQFGNYEHVVTTKDAEGHTVGHLAAQDTAPGEVTIRSNQIYDEAHRGVGKGTAAIRTLVDETAKNPAFKKVHSDITTTGAARGAWEKVAEANPDTVTKEDFNGVPRWTVDLDKVREKAANAPEFNGEERRGAARKAPMSATEMEAAMKTGQPMQTPFDVTEGAMDTINRDIAHRLETPTNTVGTAEGAARDSELFAQAKTKLGPDASFSDIAKEAQRMKTDPTVAESADAYNRQQGRPPVEHVEVGPSKYAKRIADEYDKLKHEPNNPEVQKAYGAMKKDIDKQWEFATKNMGVTFEPWNKEGQPYANSKAMVEDVNKNHHLYFFRGGELPIDHPLAAVDPTTGFTYNEKMRAVHDLFGHAANENQFGPAGEERAWQEHRQMFSTEAVPAVTTETRGQNSWVNFGKHLRDEFGNVPQKGEKGYVPPTERPYAENKAVILPQWTHEPEGKLPSNTNPWAYNYNPWAADYQSQMHREISKLHNAEGGSTYNPRMGNMNGKDAFAVPAHPELSKVVAGTKIQPSDVEAYMKQPKVAEALAADPALSVGTWANEGKTYYDLSKTISDREQAIDLGKKNNQIAIRDLKNNVDINTGGTGTPTILDQPGVGLKDLWTDQSGTYTSGAFMRYLAKNKLMSKAGQDTLETAAKDDFVPGWAEVSQFLTPEDRAQASKSVQRNVVDLVNKFNPEWVSDAAKGGSAAKGWYARATALIQHMFGDDAHRFTNFVASLSPQKDVEQNFTDALNFYNLWQDAGKPLGPENEKVIRDLTERAETGMSGQVARNQLYENLVNDIQPTGPKVSNFARNLKGNMDAVTKDRWMAYLFGNNERMFRWFKEGSPKPAVHLAADALIRAVGQSIGMLPAEVQETSWSFLRTVVNLTEKEKISPKEAIGRVNDQLIREGASELTRLIADSPKVQSALNRLATATGDERFRANNLQNSPRFKQLLQEHAEQPSTGGGAGAINRAGAERGVKKAIEARSSLSKQREEGATSSKEHPEITRLKTKYGTTSDVLKAGFITPAGDMIPLTGEHDHMLGGKTTEDTRESFIKDTGTIRTRYRMSRAGEEQVFSLPKQVTEDQVRHIAEAAGKLRNGRIVLESVAVKGHAVLDFPTGSKVREALGGIAKIKSEEEAAPKASKKAPKATSGEVIPPAESEANISPFEKRMRAAARRVVSEMQAEEKAQKGTIEGKTAPKKLKSAPPTIEGDTSFNPEDLSNNFAPTLTARMKSALS